MWIVLARKQFSYLIYMLIKKHKYLLENESLNTQQITKNKVI